MTKAGQRLIAAAKEAGLIARGEKPPTVIHGTKTTPIVTDELHASDDGGMVDALTRDQEETARERRAWSGDYDGTDCPNCGRQRMLLCTNGKRRCEKCNWDPEANTYSDGPYIG